MGFLFAVLILGLSLYFYVIFIKKPVNTYVYIPANSTVKQIAEKLEKKQVIDFYQLFVLFSYLKGKPLKSGYYEFKGNFSLKDVWEKLVKGDVIFVKVTVVPGDDLFKVASKLDKKGVVKKRVFLKKAFDKRFLKALGINKNSFEGFVVPETYFFSKNLPAEYVIKYFFKFFKKYYKIKRITPKFYKKMIIASLVEKETSISEEKRIIAGIIYKRLNLHMPLQIDATVIYALKLKNKWKGKLFKKDFKVKSEFNTYTHYGLPPTPISTFSKQTFLMISNPKRTDYLYYFTKNNKTHIFSKTYKEHLRKLRSSH